MESRGAGEGKTGGREDGRTGRREDGKKGGREDEKRGREEDGRSCRCEALQSEAKQSEAIPSGMASTTLAVMLFRHLHISVISVSSVV